MSITDRGSDAPKASSKATCNTAESSPFHPQLVQTLITTASRFSTRCTVGTTFQLAIEQLTQRSVKRTSFVAS